MLRKSILVLAVVAILGSPVLTVRAETSLLQTEQLAKQGNAQAQFDFALRYFNGEEVEKDPSRAAEWMSKAAQQGLAEAQVYLGYWYQKGIAVPADKKKAVEWFRKAADKGYVPAQAELGMCYWNGIGVAKDYQQALHWLQLAANWRSDSNTLVQEDFSAMQAQYLLGRMYDLGQGVPQDTEKAATLYRAASLNVQNIGLAYAQFSLGRMYDMGRGVRQNALEAVSLYHLAAIQGLADAQYAYAMKYKEPVGIPAESAYAWLATAAAGGMKKAETMRVKLSRQLSKEELTLGEKQAKEYIRDHAQGSGRYVNAQFFENLPPPLTEDELKVNSDK
ncbi:MAG: tetratricopeptide repeat protein [Enterobacteriaceae bacterium]|nr:tetratricopeptide repeat protein [Enterobacteriaceae bacterium]